MTSSTFEFLLRRAQSRGIPEGRQGRPMALLAKRAGISRQYLYRIMDGDDQPSDELTPKLARALGVKVSTMRRALRNTARMPKKVAKRRKPARRSTKR